jgi:hypothetical protein
MFGSVGFRRSEIVRRISLILMLAVLTTGALAETTSVPVTVLDDLEDPIAVRSWLVAGPLPSPDRPNQSWNSWPKRVGYNKDFLAEYGGEAEYKATEGARITSPDGVIVGFHEYTWNTAYIDLTEVFGRPGRVAAYLYAEVESDEARRVYFHIGSNDAAKMWVNGELVLAYPEDRGASRSQNVIVANLPEGRSRILMKIDQAGANWGAYCEVSDSPNYNYGHDGHFGSRNGRLIDANWFRPMGISGAAFAILVLLIIFGLPTAGIFLVAWLFYRYRSERDRREWEARLTQQNGTVSVPPLQPTKKRRSTNGLLVWGVVLSLAGFGLTIGELANAGLGNAGMEMAIMFVGLGLLVLYRNRDCDIHDDTEISSQQNTHTE